LADSTIDLHIMTASEITKACARWLHYKQGYEYREGDTSEFGADVDLVTDDMVLTFKICREEE